MNRAFVVVHLLLMILVVVAAVVIGDVANDLALQLDKALTVSR